MSTLHRIAGRCAWITRSPTAPMPAAGLLDVIGENWNCWRLSGESDRSFSFRLALHLEAIGIAGEDDLAAILDQRGP